LIDYDAKMNLKNKSGWTALMYACHNFELEKVKLLLKCGANPYLKNYNNVNMCNPFIKRHPELRILKEKYFSYPVTIEEIIS